MVEEIFYVEKYLNLSSKKHCCYQPCTSTVAAVMYHCIRVSLRELPGKVQWQATELSISWNPEMFSQVKLHAHGYMHCSRMFDYHLFV